MASKSRLREKETLVVPAVTLPSLPRMRAYKPKPRLEHAASPAPADTSAPAQLPTQQTGEPAAGPAPADERAIAAAPPPARQREATQARALKQRQHVSIDHRPAALPADFSPPAHRTPARVGALYVTPTDRALAVHSREHSATNIRPRERARSIVLVPIRRVRSLTQRCVPPAIRRQMRRASEHRELLRRHRLVVVVGTLLLMLLCTLMTVTSVAQVAQNWHLSLWQTSGAAVVAPPPPAPDHTDSGYYARKYGFDKPVNILPISAGERQRLTFMLPFAYRAAAAYDHRYGQSVEPEMIVWWTHAEGIDGHINFSNCSVTMPRPGTSYFSDIENCPRANFWQLGYGNQFSTIYVLKNAFTDLYGNPNDATLVQKVGQWVLNYDRQIGTVPACGGYSCTFPTKTIDQIMSGVDETTGVMTADNWWASVLSRDPAINCYMIARALTGFNHAMTRDWGGCYYDEPCWGTESDRLGDILAAWPDLRGAAHIEG